MTLLCFISLILYTYANLNISLTFWFLQYYIGIRIQLHRCMTLGGCFSRVHCPLNSDLYSWFGNCTLMCEMCSKIRCIFQVWKIDSHMVSTVIFGLSFSIIILSTEYCMCILELNKLSIPLNAERKKNKNDILWFQLGHISLSK